MPSNPENTIDRPLEELNQQVLADRDKVKPEMRVHWEASVRNILEKVRQDISNETQFVNM